MFVKSCSKVDSAFPQDNFSLYFQNTRNSSDLNWHKYFVHTKTHKKECLRIHFILKVAAQRHLIKGNEPLTNFRKRFQNLEKTLFDLSLEMTKSWKLQAKIMGSPFPKKIMDYFPYMIAQDFWHKLQENKSWNLAHKELLQYGQAQLQLQLQLHLRAEIALLSLLPVLVRHSPSGKVS